MINWQYLIDLVDAINFLIVYQKNKILTTSPEEEREVIRRKLFLMSMAIGDLSKQVTALRNAHNGLCAECDKIGENIKTVARAHDALADEVVKLRKDLNKIMAGFAGGIVEVLK